MIVIEINNVKTKISGLSPKQVEEISFLMSFEVGGAEAIARFVPKAWEWDGRKKLFRKSGIREGSGSFPTGLLPSLLAYFKENDVDIKGIKFVNEREAPEGNCGLQIKSDITLRDYQEDLVQVTNKRDRGVILLATGGGKTICSASIIENKDMETLFITPNVGLREQTAKVFKSLFGKEFVSTKVTGDAPIIVANIGSLVNKDAKYFKRFKLLLIDEFHHSSSDGYLKINNHCVNAYHRYGLTGSFVRTDGTDMVMHGVLSNVIYEKSASELIREGWLVKPRITLLEHKITRILSKNYRLAYDIATQNDDLNLMAVRIAEMKAHDEGKQVIILVRKVLHGEMIARMMKGAVFIHGEMKVADREAIQKLFVEKKVKIIVATSVLGEGTDIPAIDVLINLRYQKGEIETVQGAGRALRTTDGKNVFSEGYVGKTYCEIFDFLIRGNKHLTWHSLNRIAVYKKESEFMINRVDMNSYLVR